MTTLSSRFFRGRGWFFFGVIVLGFISPALAAPDPQELFTAAKAGNRDEIKRLLDQKTELNAVSEEGYTALIYAAYHGHEEATRFLLEAGADACRQDRRGNTALLGAIFKGNIEVAKLLVDSCDINHRNKSGQTPLMFAALFGREEMAKLLIEKGADKTLKDYEGRDAGSLAEGQWNQAMVKLLKLARVIKK